MTEPQVLEMLAALSQQTRLRIVRYLVRCGSQGASAGDVGHHVNASSSRASFHLSALDRAGVISSQRQSRNIIYRANHTEIGNLMSYLLRDCCDNHPEIRACCNLETGCC